MIYREVSGSGAYNLVPHEDRGHVKKITLVIVVDPNRRDTTAR